MESHSLIESQKVSKSLKKTSQTNTTTSTTKLSRAAKVYFNNTDTYTCMQDYRLN
jgi:hypothetical protein